MINDPYLKELHEVYLREGISAALNHIPRIVNKLITNGIGRGSYRDFELYNFGNREINKIILLGERLNSIYWYYSGSRTRSDTLLKQVRELNVLLGRDPPDFTGLDEYVFLRKMLDHAMDKVIKQIEDERIRKFDLQNLDPGTMHVDGFELLAKKLTQYGFAGHQVAAFKKRVMLNKLSK